MVDFLAGVVACLAWKKRARDGHGVAIGRFHRLSSHLAELRQRHLVRRTGGNAAAQRQIMGEYAGKKAEGGIRGIGCVRLQVYVLYPYFSMDQKAIIGVSRCP